MAVLALVAVGAGVGFSAAGIAGAVVGGALGLMVANRLTKRGAGSTLDDPKAAKVAYGSIIPYTEGHPRVGGVIIWTGNRQKTESTSSAGGSGGGGGDITTVTYTQDVMYELSENVNWEDIRRVFDNGELVFSVADDSSAASVSTSVNSERWTSMTFYPGHDTQTPDPTYEAFVGVGNAPANRTRSTVVFTGLQEGSSGQLPNLTFEGSSPNDTALYLASLILAGFAATDDSFTVPNGAAIVNSQIKVWGISGSNVVVSTADATSYALGSTATDAIPAGATAAAPGQGNGDRPFAVFGGVTGHFYVAGDGVSHDYTASGTPALGTSGIRFSTWNSKIAVGTHDAASNIYLHNVSGSSIGVATHGHAIDSLALAAATIYALSGSTVYPYDASTFVAGTTFAVPTGSGHRIFTSMQGVLCCANAAGQIFKRVGAVWVSLGTLHEATGIDMGTANCIHMVDNTDLYAVRCLNNPSPPTATLTYDQAVTAPPAGGTAYSGTIAGFDNVETFSPPTSHLSGWTNVKAYAVAWTWDDHGSIGGNFATIGPAWDGVHVTTYAGGTAPADQIHSGTTGNIICHTINEVVPNCSSDGIVRWVGTGPTGGIQCHDVYKGTTHLVALAEPTYQQVQERLCVRGGLDLSQVDATALATRNVHAMAVTQQESPRETSERLMQGYFSTVHESNGKLVFGWRGGDPVATIPYADLWAGDDGTSEPLEITKANDGEIPSVAEIKYANLYDNYQDGLERSDRGVSTATNTIQIELALGFTPTEAKHIADSAVMDAVASALTISPFSVGRKWAHLEPNDVVNLLDAVGNSHRVRLTKRTEVDGKYTFEAVSDDANVINSAADTSVTGYTNSTDVAPPVETSMVLLDIPLLRDQDDGPGVYAKVKPTTDVAYPGAVIFNSADDVTFNRLTTDNVPGIFGTATTILGSGITGQFDEVNTVTVSLGLGTAASVTRDAILNSTANAWAIGAEIIQARDATYVSPGVYILSGLLRGLQGTEWAVGTHAAGETAAYLSDAGVWRAPLNNSDTGVAKYWKGVTSGRPLTSATAQTFTNTGVSQKPRSPVDVRIARDGTGSITITWQRRSRDSTRLIGASGVSCPLAEDTEAYEVDVLDSSFTTVKRTIPVTSPTAAYSTAFQTTDYGGTQNPIYIRVYQLSSAVGRGYAGQAQG